MRSFAMVRFGRYLREQFELGALDVALGVKRLDGVVVVARALAGDRDEADVKQADNSYEKK